MNFSGVRSAGRVSGDTVQKVMNFSGVRSAGRVSSAAAFREVDGSYAGDRGKKYIYTFAHSPDIKHNT